MRVQAFLILASSFLFAKKPIDPVKDLGLATADYNYLMGLTGSMIGFSLFFTLVILTLFMMRR